MPTEYQRELETARKAILEATKRVTTLYKSQDLTVTTKADGSPVSTADEEANKHLTNQLQKAFPTDALLSEENDDDKERLSHERVWIIDPLDGTKEFLKENGEFTINVGLAINGAPLLGVISAPATNTLYWATPTGGAWKARINPEALIGYDEITRITVSNNAQPTEMVMTRSRSHATTTEKQLERHFKESTPFGSSLKGCKIAEGSADAYYRLGNTHEWDIAAMHAILNAAGGTLTDTNGKPIKYNRTDTLLHGFVASNGKAHAALLALLEEVRTKERT